MNAYPLITKLPSDVCQYINQFLVIISQKIIVKFYRKYTAHIRPIYFILDLHNHYCLYGFYQITKISCFDENLKLIQFCLNKYKYPHEFWTIIFRNLKLTYRFKSNPFPIYELILIKQYINNFTTLSGLKQL